MVFDYGKVEEYWKNIENFLQNGIYFYGIRNDEELGFYRFKKDLDFVVDHLPLQKINFLDIGCGTGNFIAYLKDRSLIWQVLIF